MWMMAAQMGLSVLSARSKAKSQHAAQKAQYEYDEKMRKYRNKMANIADAINQNAITQNTTMQIQQSARQAVHMRRDELGVLGSSAVAAAAAGVRGNSVNATLLDVQRKAGLLEKQRQTDLEGYFMQATQQRMSSSLSAIQSQDHSYVPKPTMSNYLLPALSSNPGNTMELGSALWDKGKSMFGGETWANGDSFRTGANLKI